MRLHLGCLLALALASCSDSNADTKFAKPPPATSLTVDLAAVTLGDDCAPPPPPTPAKPALPASPPLPSKTAPGSMVPGARCAGPGCGRGHCDQTTMQLSIKTPANLKPTTVKIKRVELLDANGKFLQVLTSRAPRVWAQPNAGKYVAWDEKLVPAQTVSAMYDLTAPDWGKLTGNRWQAHTKSFQVRVTVTIGNASKTVEKTSITATRLPPPVPT